MCIAASGTSLVPTRQSPSTVSYTWARSVGKKPVPYMASSRTSTGGIDGAEALAADDAQGVLHQGELAAAPGRP